MTAQPDLADRVASQPPPPPALALVATNFSGGALTVTSEVEPSRLAELEQLLLSIGQNLETETELRLRDLRLVHFVRWVIVPVAGKTGPHLLVFGSDFDGSLPQHIDELFRVCGPGLNKIYAHCRGCSGFRTAKDLASYFEANSLKAGAYYTGSRDRSAQQVLAENELQVAIANYLDTAEGRAATEHDPYDAVKRFVDGLPKPPIDTSEPPFSSESLLSRLLHGPAFWPLVVLAGAIGVVPAALLAGAVKLREWTEADDDSTHQEPALEDLDKLKSREDRRRLVQNQLTHVVRIKSGWFRLRTLKLVLWSIDFLAKHYFNRGTLGGIPSIHYARWMIMEKERLLLFFSNFDGSWESYLGDFVDQAATGLTAVWSNTVGFPRASFLLWRGARDEEHFKNWTRQHQIETQIWYSAYPSLSIQNVNDNTRLRAGLARKPAREELSAWLRTL